MKMSLNGCTILNRGFPFLESETFYPHQPCIHAMVSSNYVLQISIKESLVQIEAHLDYVSSFGLSVYVFSTSWYHFLSILVDCTAY